MVNEQANIIILDIIQDRGADQQISTACSNLNTRYHSQNLTANTPQSFAWGSTNNLNDPIKIKIGSAVVLLEYRGGSEEVNAFGACNGTDYNDFNAGSQVLEYNDGSLTFLLEFQLIDGMAIQITAEAGSNTTLEAYE